MPNLAGSWLAHAPLCCCCCCNPQASPLWREPSPSGCDGFTGAMRVVWVRQHFCATCHRSRLATWLLVLQPCVSTPVPPRLNPLAWSLRALVAIELGSPPWSVPSSSPGITGARYGLGWCRLARLHCSGSLPMRAPSLTMHCAPLGRPAGPNARASRVPPIPPP